MEIASFFHDFRNNEPTLGRVLRASEPGPEGAGLESHFDDDQIKPSTTRARGALKTSLTTPSVGAEDAASDCCQRDARIPRSLTSTLPLRSKSPCAKTCPDFCQLLARMPR